ncbi:hypothetical protein [Fluviicoccus keumensis]|uniref:hypothetical protein n=1 Tax=Fluviicoccus keumensis TaxID=1435465 RepID=UPI001F5E8151|nr:hypothetical protein [Fluviicoccus keumensis]
MEIDAGASATDCRNRVAEKTVGISPASVSGRKTSAAGADRTNATERMASTNGRLIKEFPLLFIINLNASGAVS